MRNLSQYKKGFPTHMTHYSNFFFSREREIERETGERARFSKGGKISSLKKFNLKKVCLFPYEFW